MALSPFSLELDVIPFFFRFRDQIFGHGFVALVETTGRAMCETEPSGEFTVAGVEPGGLAASGDTCEAALQAFRQTFRMVLMDIATEAPTFEAFHAEVRRFIHETSPATLADWATAVEAARVVADRTPGVARVRPDMPVSVAVSCSTDLVPQQNVIDEPSQQVAA